MPEKFEHNEVVSATIVTDEDRIPLDWDLIKSNLPEGVELEPTTPLAYRLKSGQIEEGDFSSAIERCKEVYEGLLAIMVSDKNDPDDLTSINKIVDQIKPHIIVAKS